MSVGSTIAKGLDHLVRNGVEDVPHEVLPVAATSGKSGPRLREQRLETRYLSFRNS